MAGGSCSWTSAPERTFVAEIAACRETLAGTPLYLAPEIFERGEPSVSADIYSLGVLLFHLVTGLYPVEGQTRAGVQRAHQRRERKYLHDVRPDLPRRSSASSNEPSSTTRTIGIAPRANSKPRWRACPDRRRMPSSSAPAPRNDARVGAGLERAALMAIGVAIAILAVGAILWSGIASRSNERTPPPATWPCEPCPLAPRTAPGDRVSRGLSLHRDGQNIRLRQGARVVPGDRLFLEFESSQPVFVYVVNQDEDGESYLLFPIPGTVPPTPCRRDSRIGCRGGAAARISTGRFPASEAVSISMFSRA